MRPGRTFLSTALICGSVAALPASAASTANNSPGSAQNGTANSSNAAASSSVLQNLTGIGIPSGSNTSPGAGVGLIPSGNGSGAVKLPDLPARPGMLGSAPATGQAAASGNLNGNAVAATAGMNGVSVSPIATNQQANNGTVGNAQVRTASNQPASSPNRSNANGSGTKETPPNNASKQSATGNPNSEHANGG